MRLWSRYRETVKANWHLGFTCFGGPAVQFQTFHKRFVQEYGWIDEKMFQQIFCLSQSLPGSASVKMLLCINACRSGLVAGFLAFLMFSLPGAVGMYGLAVGVLRVKSELPRPVYALLSGLNAATVGVIALAGVKLAQRAISDKITRLLVYFGGVLGMLYTALWYYPVLMVSAGLLTFVWDMRFLHVLWSHLEESCKRRKLEFQNWRANRQKQCYACRHSMAHITEKGAVDYHTAWMEKPLPDLPNSEYSTPKRISSIKSCTPSYADGSNLTNDIPLHPLPEEKAVSDIPSMSWQVGSLILVIFGLSFILFITLHILMPHLSRVFELFSSLYLAGTIIFGGGPVVIPLLRSYIVTPGWVSPRDFLLGIAIIQAFPGPNFNFVVYLGALSVSPSYVGALIAFTAMYTPGLFIVVGFMGLWRRISEKKWFLGTLRGINAAAVGLVFTAVVKLWNIGRMQEGVPGGSPLGGDSWLVLITATAYVGGAWFGVEAPVAILMGGALGVGRYGVVQAVKG